MKLYITGHQGAVPILKERPGKYDVIVYTNSHFPLPREFKKNTKSHIHFPVDDIDKERSGHVMPSIGTVKNFLDWSVDKDEIMCVCHAGISRSSSTAYVIAASRLGAEKALEYLTPQKHWPNRLIVWIGSQILADPSIWDTFAEWQREFSGMDPESDFHFPEVAF